MRQSWDVRVDFNTYPGPDLVYGNARHAQAGVVVREAAVLVLGDDDWGVVRAEIVEFDEATGSFTACLLGDIVPSASRRSLPDVSRLDRISADPEICHGKPTIRGLRHPVADILGLMAGGMTVDEVLADHPDLERDDILAALEYGALLAGRRRIPLSG